MEKTLQKVLEQVPPDYYETGVKTNLLQKYWHKKKWSELREFIDIRKGNLLDIGCADGLTSSQVLKFFPKLKITGIDYYKATIDYAKKNREGITFLVADAHRLPFKSNSFNLVTTIEVLEHLKDPKKALGEIRRILKPGGNLIIIQDTDSLLFKAVWWFWTKWKGSVWNNSHINCVRPDSLIKIVQEHGFKIEKIKYTNLKMEVFIKASKLKNRHKREK